MFDRQVDSDEFAFETKECSDATFSWLPDKYQAHEIELGNGMLPKVSVYVCVVVNSGNPPKLSICLHAHTLFYFSSFYFFVFCSFYFDLHIAHYATYHAITVTSSLKAESLKAESSYPSRLLFK